jgi:hypothetical protein
MVMTIKRGREIADAILDRRPELVARWRKRGIIADTGVDHQAVARAARRMDRTP